MSKIFVIAGLHIVFTNHNGKIIIICTQASSLKLNALLSETFSKILFMVI